MAVLGAQVQDTVGTQAVLSGTPGPHGEARVGAAVMAFDLEKHEVALLGEHELPFGMADATDGERYSLAFFCNSHVTLMAREYEAGTYAIKDSALSALQWQRMVREAHDA